MNLKLKNIVTETDFAFQPIIDSYTNIVYAHEALLRNFEKLGFGNIQQIFDYACNNNFLYKLDLALLEKVLKKFKQIKGYKNIKLFYKLDNRVLEMPYYSITKVDRIITESEISKENICFEVSRLHKINEFFKVKEILDQYKNLGYNIAINDFGNGFSNYRKLYSLDPDILKIDNFFLNQINKDVKKQFFTSNIVNLVHTLGGIIIANGIENKEEFHTCKKIGCDLVQGYYIQKPLLDISELKLEYFSEKYSYENENIFSNENKIIIKEKLKQTHVLNLENNMEDLLDLLKENKDIFLIIIIDNSGKPLGVIEEPIIKKYLYKLYGRQILSKKKIKDLMSPCITCDINFEISKIIDILNLNKGIKQIIVVEKGKYVGYLDLISIISIVSENKLMNARDQNPLTKLPGNNMIHKYINETLNLNLTNSVYSYFDFNNFKAFNDKYGFNKGDEAILLFANLMSKKEHNLEYFYGHIGGDDFFLGIKHTKDEEFCKIYDKILKLIQNFNEKVKEFYSKEDIKRGYIKSKDREGNIKNFPLLTVSSSLLILKKEYKKEYNLEDISNIMFKLKKTSKLKGVSISSATLYK